MGLTDTTDVILGGWVKKRIEKNGSRGKISDAGEKRTPPKIQKELLTQVRGIADPLCTAEGMELVHLEYQREPAGNILRVYIDKPGGVSLDNCTNISRQLGDLLDIHIEFGSTYRLEVSSPGTDRPLSKENDFERFKGETARIRIAQAINGQKNFKGVLLGIENGVVRLAENDRIIPIPYKNITKARLVDYYGENKCL